MAELDAEQLSFNNAQDLVVLSDTIVYYLNVKMAAMDKNANFRVPGAMEKIIELARTLPSPTPEEWGSLAVGRISTKRKFKGASSGDDNRSKTRAKWTEENKRELVELVDDEEKRKLILGDKANHAGHINWTALARRYGFAGAGPLYRQYQLMTGREPPGVKPKVEGRSSKLEEMIDDNGVPHVGPPMGTEWTQEKCDYLVKLVHDEDFRKAETGKKTLKWSRISETVRMPRKECKKKYTDLTGQPIHD